MHRNGKIGKLISFLLAVLILYISTVPSYALIVSFEPESTVPVSDVVAAEPAEAETAESRTEPTEAPTESTELEAGQTEPTTDATETAAEPTAATKPSEAPYEPVPSDTEQARVSLPVYRDKVILVYSYAQLCLIGTDAVLTDADADPEAIGTGTPVREKELTITYSASASYAIVTDIAMPESERWTLPKDFAGSIAPLAEPIEPILYDAETDTLFLHHPYQLEVFALEDADVQPVLTGDAVSETFGIGQPVQKKDGTLLTYGNSGALMISADFTTEGDPSPAVKAEEDEARRDGNRSPNDPKAGRDFVGQVIKKIDGVTYILIGNESQLRAIGTDQEVFTPVYQTDYTLSGHVLDLNNQGDPILLYGGDADLLSAENGVSDYSFHTILDKTKTARYYTGVDQETGEPYLDAVHCTSYKDSALGGWHTGEYYTIKANYIIFRNIDLRSVAWTPLMFTGTMYGSRSLNGEKLWDGTGITDSTELTRLDAAHRPQIENVLVNQTGTLYVNRYEGIGFFATVTNRTNTANIGVSGGTAIIQNVELHDVAVNNNSTTADVDQTLLNAVTSGLGTVLGGLLDGVLWALSFGSANTDLNTTLSNLLNARAQDPTVFATGAFAGRVVGDVCIEDCCVTGTVTVSNVKDRTAGFIGYSVGFTEYSGLSQVLGGLVDVLAAVLNAVPAVGLGDLITILLGNALPLESLIPTGYIAPAVSNCYVEGLTGNVGRTDRDFAAGFIAHQIGTRIEGCAVTDSDYDVLAQNYGGGFAGLGRDAEIKGTLDGVGIDLSSIIQDIHPQSVLKDCSITDSDVTVTGGNMLGGFVGALCSSYAADCTIDTTANDPLSVTGTGDAIGGFCGYATVGWQSTMGQTENTENSLLGTVRQLATGLLSTNPSQGQKLLSLIGVAPSAILGCQARCSELTVQAGDSTHEGSFAGGFLGKGDGIYLAPSDSTSYAEIADWNSGTLDATPNNRPIVLEGLKSVYATEHFAGGVAGYMGSAAFQGLLNDVVGLGDFIGFHVRDVSLTGVQDGYRVKADGDNAGGGFGATVGGTVDTVVLDELQYVEANNRAAGFVGLSGPGELAGTGGLTINLLGLDRVLNASNLLNVGQGLEVHITDSSVTGVDSGFTVEALGSNFGNGTVIPYTASGFVAKSNSTKIVNSHTYDLLSVTAAANNGYAGGFIGTSETGGLADVADENSIRSLIEVDGLVTAIGYLIPSYTNCTVHYVDGGWVDADLAGGFVADFMSGTVDNSSRTVTNSNTDPPTSTADPYAVYNIDHVTGRTYGGGFGGRVVSGALANAAGGISVLGGLSSLNVNVDDLLGVINAYVPFIKYAGVYSENGFTVEARTIRSADLSSGSAGGFIGYASGAQVTHSDVNKLKHTNVTPPDDLEAVNAPTYFNIGTGSGQSSYAVTGGNFAGGYVGEMDIGSAASLGSGLNILGNTIGLTNVLSAVNAVVTTVEHSNVYGAPGGFSVLATGLDAGGGKVGRSGGFAGAICGGHIQNSHSNNFYYIIGEIAAGGYVGEMTPSNVAKLLDDGNILGNLVDIDSSLASLVEDFVPTIRNSTTSCVPCGGAVRAHSPSDSAIQRGMAGGYCGQNEGGHIWGYDNHVWKDQNDGVNALGNQTNDPNIGHYTGPKNECRADRIRSVYGFEYAGGFTGFMEPADTAGTGGISLLGGLLAEVQNPLKALSVVYPTEENTAIYGPLWHLDVNTWNAWVSYVGRFGGYGAELANLGAVSTQAELDRILSDYIYGCSVVAGRNAHDPMLISEGGDAGGYVGLMCSGTVTNGQTYDVRLVRSLRSAGGFAGKLQTGGAAEFGSLSLFGGNVNLNLGSLLQAAEVFVPVIKSSSTRGYQSGLVVECTGADRTHGCGYAGGYVGSSYGGQIWGDEGNTLYTNSGAVTNSASGCSVYKLRSVRGKNAVGGYAGLVTAASVVNANSNASTGFLQGLLNSVIQSPGNLASVLQATMATIRQAEVTPDDADYGIVVGGLNGTVPNFAGGFIGSSEAAVIGSRTGESAITVNGLRSVDGGLYAGGFFGLADVTSLASVSNSGQSQTSVLGLVNLEHVSVLDAFRTYVYYANVHGVPEGAVIRAHRTDTEGILGEQRHAGSAGGFGGGLMNGTVTHSNVTNLSTVEGLNYVGGFIGHMGKNGVADVDSAKALNLLGLTAGVLDVFGSQIEDCTVTGIWPGIVAKAEGGAEPIAGGFCGYADISRIKRSDTLYLKQVSSDQIAGGFVGKTEMQYLVEIHADSPVVDLVLSIVNVLLKILYVNGLENLDLIDTTQYPILSTLKNVLAIKLLADGDLLYINLLGLRIGVSLVRATEPGQTDTAIVTIGDSSVRLPCTDQGIDTASANEEIAVNLIKGNRTKVENCTVTGIYDGYDVYGGGSGNDTDGSHASGYSGGFVGYNNEGHLLDNEMIWCDVVRGTAGKVGPFSGTTYLQSVYSFNTLDSIEGEDNFYSIYRDSDPSYLYALTDGGDQIGAAVVSDTQTGTTFNRYRVQHLATPIAAFSDWEDAVMSTDVSGTDTRTIDVYESAAKAVLMKDTPMGPNDTSTVPAPAPMQDPCEETMDLTIHKRWLDANDMDGVRTNAIRVRIWIYQLDDNGLYITDPSPNPGEDPVRRKTLYLDNSLPTDANGWFELTAAADGTLGSSVWTKVIEDLPVYSEELDPVTGDPTGHLIYYQYDVEEEPVDKYITAIVWNEEHTECTITNTHNSMLPLTGGPGDYLNVLIGVLLILLGFCYTQTPDRWKRDLRKAFPKQHFRSSA